MRNNLGAVSYFFDGGVGFQIYLLPQSILYSLGFKLCQRRLNYFDSIAQP